MSTHASNDHVRRIIEDFSVREGRLVAVETRIENMATKEDIALLKGEIETSKEELKRFISESVSQSEINTLKGFVKLWVIVAGALVSVLTTVLSFFANRLVSL